MKKNWKKILVAVLFLDFAAFTGYVLYQHGYMGFWKLAFANTASMQILVDLTLALVFVMGLMIKDARARGVNVAPYVVLTLALGSLGPMLYYLLRKDAPESMPNTATQGVAQRSAAAA